MTPQIHRLKYGEVFSLDEPAGSSRWKVAAESSDLVVLVECVGTMTHRHYRMGEVGGQRADFLDVSGPKTGDRRLICRAVVLRGEP